MRFGLSFALLSVKRPRVGVIFVHGFDGGPTTTWVDFRGMMRHDGNQIAFWRDCDLFFYSYVSSDQIPALAEQFLDFLTSVAAVKGQDLSDSEYPLPSSKDYVLGSRPELAKLRGEDPYEALILVGHSTGAVIIRKAIEDRIKTVLKDHPDSAKWESSIGDGAVASYDLLIAKSSLRFFAPAHLGFLGAGKLGAAKQIPIIDRIVGIHLESKPLFHNLKHDCPTLVDLRASTEKLYEKHKQLRAFKATMLFGTHEEIVYQGGYDHDDLLPTVPGHYHSSICKPNVDYLKPVEFVTAQTASAKNA